MATALPAGHDRDSVLRATKTLVRANPSMTALVVHNEAAPRWIAGCPRAAGRQVPGDVAVVAICSDDLAEQMSPPLMLLPPRLSRCAD